jgi:P21-Rho-binding domain
VIVTENFRVAPVKQNKTMFTKKKKKPEISLPSNFEHRVHTGFDKREGRYVGLPLQWASIVGNNQILKSTNRPLPLVDPSEITPTEILDLKTIVRPHGLAVDPKTMGNNGIVLPKTSHVARSNSLRSSPPRVRRDLRGNANVPPSVPEEPPSGPGMGKPGVQNGPLMQQMPAGPHPDWNHRHFVNNGPQNQQFTNGNNINNNTLVSGGIIPQNENQLLYQNGGVNNIPAMNPINTELQAPYFNR